MRWGLGLDAMPHNVPIWTRKVLVLGIGDWISSHRFDDGLIVGKSYTVFELYDERKHVEFKKVKKIAEFMLKKR